jgi:hypothetical protein
MSLPRFTKTFDRHTSRTENYRDATLWLREHGLSGALDEMVHGDWVLTLEGEDAKRAQDIENPIDKDGFRLAEVS